MALDLFQSSNGLDFLGIVIFRHLFTLDKPATVERFVLECIRFVVHLYVHLYSNANNCLVSYTDAHTGEALAKVLHSVMQKFKIEDRVSVLQSFTRSLTNITRFGALFVTMRPTMRR